MKIVTFREDQAPVFLVAGDCQHVAEVFFCLQRRLNFNSNKYWYLLPVNSPSGTTIFVKVTALASLARLDRRLLELASSGRLTKASRPRGGCWLLSSLLM